MFFKKGVLKHSTKFTGKRLRHKLLLNKVAGLRQVYLTYQSNQSKMNASKKFRNIWTSEKVKIVV